MKRDLDAFEKFHQQRKRRPLGDISVAQNIAKCLHPKSQGKGIKISHLKHLTKTPSPSPRDKNLNSILNLHHLINKIESKPTLEESVSLLKSTSSEDSTKASNKSGQKNSHSFYRSSDEKKTAVDYNSIVADSNRAIEKFDSWYKINNYDFTCKDPVTKRGEMSDNEMAIEYQKEPQNSDNPGDSTHTVRSVNVAGDSLLAVSINDYSEVILIMNRSKEMLKPLDIISLGQYKKYTVNGLPTKVYSTWKVYR